MMKNTILFGCLLIACLVATGDLQRVCNTCSLTLSENCLGNSSTTVTCAAGEQCFIRTLNFSSVVLRQKGCISRCTSPGFMVFDENARNINETCCNTDQCNGASPTHVLLPPVISAALLALWTGQ